MDVSIAFDKLKLSALTKSKHINSYIRSVTLGPNAEILSNDRPQLTVTLTQDKHNKCDDKIFKRFDQSDGRIASITQKCSLDKIQYEAETQRQEEVRRQVAKKAEFLQQVTTRNREKAKENIKIRTKYLIDRLHQEEQELENEMKTFELQTKLENEKLQKLHQIQKEKTSENAQKLQEIEKENERLKILDSLLILQKDYKTRCKTINENIRQFSDSGGDLSLIKKFSLEQAEKMKIWDENLNNIIFACKNGSIDQKLIGKVQSIIQDISTLSQKISHEIEISKKAAALQKAEELQKLKEQEAEIQKARAAAAAAAASQVTEKPKTPIVQVPSSQNNEFVSHSSKLNYEQLEMFCQKFEASFVNFSTDERFKKYRFDLQKAINMPINAITAVNGQHLTDKLNRLAKLLSGKTVEVGNTAVSASQHPEAINYCKNLLAKKFVRQGDLMVSSNPKSAFAFAAVIVALWNHYPDFGKLLMAHFYRECIYLVPMFLPQAEGQTNEDYYKSLGYRYTDGVVEDQDKFLRRMSGTIRLYSAILVTKQRRASAQEPHPHGLRFAWRWLSAMLNLEPQIDISATALYQVLEVTGHHLNQAYGKQFNKLIRVLYKSYLPRLEKIDSGGPVVRLQVFLTNVFKERGIRRPEGFLPENFW